MGAFTAISLVGSGFGLWLGSPLLWSTGASAVARRLLGALLTTAAIASALIAVGHAGYLPSTQWAEWVECSLTLVAGPLLLLYVRSASGRPPTWRDAGHVIPVAVFIAYVVTAATLWALPPISIRQILVIQIGYTVAAGWTYLRVPAGSKHGEDGWPHWPAVILTGFVLVHLAQLVRLSWHGAAAREAVPMAVTAAFLLFGAAGFHRGLAASGARPASGGRYARSALRADRVQRHLAALVRVIETERAFTDPELTLAAVAARVGVPPYQVSQLLNQHLECTFSDWVNDHRLREVKTQLLDPRNDCFTIEAVSRTAGFRSRAGFYKVFGRATGLTPSEFRRRGRLRSAD